MSEPSNSAQKKPSESWGTYIVRVAVDGALEDRDHLSERGLLEEAAIRAIAETCLYLHDESMTAMSDPQRDEYIAIKEALKALVDETLRDESPFLGEDE